MIQDRRIEKGDGVFISEWKIEHHALFMMAGFLNPDNLMVGSQYETFEKLIFKKFDGITKMEPDFDADFYKKQIQDIGGFFIKGDRSAYSLSAFIATNLFHNGPENHMKAKMLIYPTVSNNYNGVNFAIERNFAEKHLKLTGINNGKFGDFQEVGFKINSDKIYKVENEYIAWNTI